MFRKLSRASFISATVILFAGVQIGCSAEASKVPESHSSGIATTNESAPKGATIDIQPNSPADTVRAFYTKLREKKFREAIFLTNLRPAIEGLTDDELKEFAVDFEAISKIVPPVIEINGEIISGDQATVTAKLPDDDEKLKLQQLRLRKEGNIWVILSVDEDAEKVIKKEGKNYFYALRIDTHQEEARKMLERVAKAQMVYSLQNKGAYAETANLIELGFLPPDITSSESTGYVYTLNLAADRMSYKATATPAVYGKTGRLSYILELDASGKPRMRSIENGGKKIAM